MKVQVGAVNDAPVAVADAVQTSEDTEILIRVLANDSDIEGDPLVISSATGAKNGSTQIIADTEIIYTPAPDWNGTDTFVYTISDGGGKTATAQVKVQVGAVNDAPIAVGTIPPQTLDEGAGPATLQITSYFDDPDEDPLVYSAVSSNPEILTVFTSGVTLTLTQRRYGEASITVTAQDPGELEAVQTFPVNVSDQLARAVMNETLAAMARAHIGSARMTLSSRVQRSGTGPLLIVSGHRIPFSRKEFGQRLEQWAMRAGLSGGETKWELPFGGESQDILPRRAWRFWGQGDMQTFTGTPTAKQNYEGDLLTAWTGIDRSLGRYFLAGIALARSIARADWSTGAVSGQLETSLTAVHPYLHWSNSVTSIWAMAGRGWGFADNRRDTGDRGESMLDLQLGLVEAEYQFNGWLGLRANAAWASLATASGTETLDNHHVTVDQQRLGIKLNPSVQLDYFLIDPFVEASARRDGGEGQTGSGLEVAAGFQASGGLIHLEAHGRILLLHSASSYEERGLGIKLGVGRPEKEGFSLSISPRWGGPGNAANALWQEQLNTSATTYNAWSLNSTARYASRLPGGQLLEWFSSVGHSVQGWRGTLGVRNNRPLWR